MLSSRKRRVEREAEPAGAVCAGVGVGGPVGLRGGVGCGPGEALGDAVEPEAAVEAVGEAREVALRVLRADVAVGADERGLDVPQAGVDPPERRPACGLL